ncbi:MAG: Rhs element Vgr protein, partial [Acidobacteriota bacterium]
MSPASPLAVEDALVSVAITANGEAIDSTFQVVSIDTWSAVNRVPRARIVLYDGSAPEQTFPISDLGTFLPGTPIEISAGYNGALQTIFSGIVIAHGIEIPRNAASTLVVDVVDTAIKMTISRKSAVFEKIKDADLIGQLISASGLSNEVDTTTTVHESVFQYDATDWDTMLLRAELNGLMVTTEAGKITVKAPDTSQAPPLRVSYGESI